MVERESDATKKRWPPAMLWMTRMISMSRLALITLVSVTGCHVQAAEGVTPTPDSIDVLQTRDLALRYGFALKVFDRGSYEEAADLFVQLLLDVPPDASGDSLRHLLIQHIGWSLLGAYDMRGDPTRLDDGEQLLERYLVKHEALLPQATAEREDVYELLGEYQIRREGEPPPAANNQLRALVKDTLSSFSAQLAPRRQDVEDDLVRVIEVQTIPWAKPDHPRVSAFFRDGRDTGPSLFDNPGEPMNPTRVLVRGLVRQAKAHSGERATKRAYALLRSARPELERCYEQALGRGANLLERLELGLAWDADALAEIGVEDEHGLDSQASSCVRGALRDADRVAKGEAGEAQAKLLLTFLVQFERGAPGAQELDYNHFGPQEALRLEITQTPR